MFHLESLSRRFAQARDEWTAGGAAGADVHSGCDTLACRQRPRPARVPAACAAPNAPRRRRRRYWQLAAVSGRQRALGRERDCAERSRKSAQRVQLRAALCRLGLPASAADDWLASCDVPLRIVIVSFSPHVAASTAFTLLIGLSLRPAVGSRQHARAPRCKHLWRGGPQIANRSTCCGLLLALTVCRKDLVLAPCLCAGHFPLRSPLKFTAVASGAIWLSSLSDAAGLNAADCDRHATSLATPLWLASLRTVRCLDVLADLAWSRTRTLLEEAHALPAPCTRCRRTGTCVGLWQCPGRWQPC